MSNLFGENEEKKDKEVPEEESANNEYDFEEPQSFENGIERLENLVQELESGSIGLQESLLLYKEARKLAAWCYNKLTAFQGELKTLGLSEGGEFTLDDLPPVE